MRTLTLIVFAAACRTLPADPPAQPAPKPVAVAPEPEPQLDPTQVARGAYVAALAGCKACHSPMKNGASDGTKPYAGGLEVKMPNGSVWRAPNITPDRASGIGRWSDTELVTAMRRGIAKDGTKLLPIMPYPYYHRMTDADAKAVVAFLRSQRPIYNEVEKSDTASVAPIDLPEPVNNVDDPKDPKSHGEYLAALMHCGQCHTPTEGAMANVIFAGGVELPTQTGSSVMSANITSDKVTGIGQWTEEELVTAIRTGKTPTGHVIEGPMAMYLEGWSMIEDADAHALVRYIQSVQPANHDVPEKHVAPVTSLR